MPKVTEVIENTTVSVSTVVKIVFAIFAIAGAWFGLKSEIREARNLPNPPVTRLEFDMKTQYLGEEIEELKKDLEKIQDE